jgi:hypothetical protein
MQAKEKLEEDNRRFAAEADDANYESSAFDEEEKESRARLDAKENGFDIKGASFSRARIRRPDDGGQRT